MDVKAVEVKNLEKSYGENQALKGLSFSVEEGENFAIIGPNGAGKTTAMKSISGLIEHDSGIIRVFGEELGEDNREKMQRRIGYMPEESAVYDNMRTREYLMFFADMYRVPEEEASETIEDLRQKLELTESDMEKKMGELSKGMKRKVLLIRSLINDPELLIYDEPASGLDPVTADFLLRFIRELDATLILTGHNLVHVEKLADRVLVLNEGEKEMMGGVDEIGRRTSIFTVETGTGVKHFQGVEELMEFAEDNREKIQDLKVEKQGLEEVFLEKFSD